MKELLAILSLIVSGAVAQYAPSGWRPSGPSFELPQRRQQGQPTTNQQYLPPVDPRSVTPQPGNTPDVSVQGLPQPEQRPLFQASPISGQQYSGPSFNRDLKMLDESLRQLQYQQQQERYREYQRQKQLEAAQSSSHTNRLPNPTNPRQFARTTTTEAPTTEVTSTTGLDLNQEEVLNDSELPKTVKTSVEVTKQDVQEYPGELFLSSLAQLQLQPQFIPLQTGAYVQTPQSQKQVAGFDGPAHFSALPSVLAQQQGQSLKPAYLVQSEPQLLVQQPVSQFAQAQVTQYQPQVQQYQPQPQYQPQVQTQYQPDPVVLQSPAQFQPNAFPQPNPDAVPVQPAQYSPAFAYQPAIQPQTQPQPAFTQQPTFVQPQLNYAQPDTEDIQNQQQLQSQNNQNQQQFYQQPIVVQPQEQQQFPAQFNQFDQAQNQYDNQYVQPQLSQGQFIQAGQPQFYQPNQPEAQLGPQVQLQNQYGPPGQLIQAGQPQSQFQPIGQSQNQYGPPPLSQEQLIQGQPQSQFQPIGQSQNQYGPPPLSQGQLIQAQPQTQYQPAQSQQYAGLVQPEIQFLQPQYNEPQSTDLQNQYQPQFLQQMVQLQNQYLQPQYAAPQNQFQQQSQGQDSLQSGLDVDKDGNDIDDPEDNEDQGATAVATAFGSRTQPRVNTRYGAPFPVPKVQASPEYSTTESAVEEITEGPAVAEAVAVANGDRRKSARLRSRRIRPTYAVDRSGRLVLAEA